MMIFPFWFCVQWAGTIASRIERKQRPLPSVIVIGAGISGIAAARSLYDASFKVSYHYDLPYSLFVLSIVFRPGNIFFFLLSALTCSHNLGRWLYWSHGTDLVAAFILTTHLVVQLTWEPHGKFNLFQLDSFCCTHYFVAERWTEFVQILFMIF